MRIGELAQRAAIRVDTVRYYEKVGLLLPPQRQDNGYRDYDNADLERLAFIRHCRALDISLVDIGQLLDLAASPRADCGRVNSLVEAQLMRVKGRISELRTLEQQLESLRTKCASQTSVAHCGILKEIVSASHGESCICHPDQEKRRE